MDSGDLQPAVEGFAQELETLLRSVLGQDTPAFEVVTAPSPTQDGTTRFIVRPEVSPGSKSAGIVLRINQEPALALNISYRCKWDHVGMYLAVDDASWSVASLDIAEPLFRYEYVSNQKEELPAAHLHVHAHRDEAVYTLFRAGVGRPGSRSRAVMSARSNLPRLKDVHFPLGGDRMRPCLEDLLELLIEEFAIDHEPAAKPALTEGRARWRRHQTGAAVRDAPGVAARVLAELGYDVRPPASGPHPEREQKLKRY